MAKVYRFGPYELNLASYEVRKRNRRVRLPASAMELLQLFLERSGELVSRDEIASVLWSEPETVDVVQGINTAVNRLRTVLGDDPASPVYIETVIGRGYRFIATVTASEEKADSPAAAEIGDSLPASSPGVPPPSSPVGDEPLFAENASAQTGTESAVLTRLRLEDSNPSFEEERRPGGRTGLAARVNPEVATKPRTGRVLATRFGIWLVCFLVAGTCAAVWLLRHKFVPTAAFTTTPHQLFFIQATFNDGDARVTAQAVSHQGDTVAYSDQSGISVRSIAAGFDRVLPSPPSFRVKRITWYPSDTQLLVSGYPNVGAKPQVWLVSLRAQAPRLLLQDAGEAVISPAGSKMAFTRYGNSEVWLADSNGQNARKLVSTGEGETITFLIWAPRGDRLVLIKRRTYAHAPDKNTPLDELESQFQSDYESVSASTGALLSEERNIRFDSVFLLPDGSMLYPQNGYLQEHPVAQLLMVKTDLNSGRFLSDPKPVDEVNGDRAGSLSGSDDGQRVGMAVERRSPEVFVGELRQPGPVLVSSRRLSHHASDAYPHGWTADGRAVVYESNDSGRYAIFKRRLDATAPELLARLGEDLTLPEVSPDGRWVLFQEIDPSPKQHAEAILRVSVNGGRPELVPTEDSFDEFDCPASSRGTCVLRKTVGKQFIYYALDPVLGKGRELGRTDWMPNVLADWGVAPDSSMVALANHDPAHPGIRLVTLSSPSKCTVVDIPVPNYGIILKPTWSPDARGFFVEAKTEVGYSLLYVERKGNVRVLKETPNPIWGVPTRDGTRLAFVDQSASANVWVSQATAP